MQGPGLLELNAVAAVATHRNFRRAAAELGLSPSALSHAIATLERRLGVRLINRTTRSVALSEAGERFLARVRPALHEIAGAMEAVNEFRDRPAGLLRLNASERAARHVLTPVVAEFLRRYPDMRVELAAENRLADIVAEGFDAGIRIAESVPRDMIAVPCGPDARFVVAGSPAYFTAHPKPAVPADLFGHNCIRRRMANGVLFRWEFERRGEETALDVPGSLTLSNDALMVEAALAAIGLIHLHESWVEEHVAAGRLELVLEDWTPAYPDLRLFYPANRHMPAGLRAFVDVVRETAARRRPSRVPAPELTSAPRRA